MATIHWPKGPYTRGRGPFDPRPDAPNTHPEAAQYPEAEDAAALLSINTGLLVTAEDYCNWMEPEDDAAYRRFDVAVHALLGPRLVQLGESAARLQGVLLAVLGLPIGPKHERDLAQSIIAEATQEARERAHPYP